MSASILTYSKSVGIETDMNTKDFGSDFLDIFKKELERSYIQNIELHKNELRFKAPIFRFTWNGWNVFNPVSSGKIKIIDK